MERLEDIRRLADAVCRHRAMAEAWVPKAGWQGFRFDVRVLVIAGQACHTVARLARGPFTNLQIGNGRRTADALRERIGGGAFSAMLEEAERAMACFPRSLHGGVDVALRAGDHRPFVLEVNAFGDLLPGVYHRGRDTYETELAALPGPRGHQVSATG